MSALNRLPVGDVPGFSDEVERMFRQVFGELDRPSTAGAWSPALDVEEDENAFILYIEVPGIRAEDVEVSLEENVLTIAGQRDFYEAKDAGGFRRVERRFGRFHRAVRLPDRVDSDRVEASYANGLLTVTVPKAEEAKPRRIQVHSG